jgi:hypothetical protein
MVRRGAFRPRQNNRRASVSTWSPEGKGFKTAPAGNGPQLAIVLTGCRADLVDNFIYHDSQFINSHLNYSGDGPLRFATSNKVPGSTLTIGTQVDTTRTDVKSLMCDFPWKAVYNGDHEIHPSCK